MEPKIPLDGKEERGAPGLLEGGKSSAEHL